MNTKDIQLDMPTLPWRDAKGEDALPVGGGDMLATMFAGQEQLLEKYEDIERRNMAHVVTQANRGALDDRVVQMRIKDLAYRTVEELSEATNCLKNKPWKNTFVATDVDHFKEELADALHFFLELIMTAGISAEELFSLYFRKHHVNQFRQESNY